MKNKSTNTVGTVPKSKISFLAWYRYFNKKWRVYASFMGPSQLQIYDNQWSPKTKWKTESLNSNTEIYVYVNMSEIHSFGGFW